VKALLAPLLDLHIVATCGLRAASGAERPAAGAFAADRRDRCRRGHRKRREAATGRWAGVSS
jgi:hypothetical protein